MGIVCKALGMRSRTNREPGKHGMYHSSAPLYMGSHGFLPSRGSLVGIVMRTMMTDMTTARAKVICKARE